MEEDGGAAFPRAQVGDGKTYNTQSQPGMSLRDYIAIHATYDDFKEFVPKTFGDICSWGEAHGYLKPSKYRDSARDSMSVPCVDIIVWARYQYADAMIKGRFK